MTFDFKTSKMTISIYIVHIRNRVRPHCNGVPVDVLPFYAIAFPPKQYPEVWASIREVRALDNEYNPRSCTQWFRRWDPLPQDAFKSTYITDTEYSLGWKARPRNLYKTVHNNKIEIDRTQLTTRIKNLSKDENQQRIRRSNMQSIGGILKECRNSGRAMASQPVGFTAGTVMRDYQKMSLSFLLDLELGKSAGVYQDVKLANSATRLQYYPGTDLWRVAKRNSTWSLGSRRGGMLCDEMGLGKTVVSLALIMANPPPGSEFQNRLLGVESSSTNVVVEEVEEEEETKMDVDEMNEEDETSISKDMVKKYRDKFKLLKKNLKHEHTEQKTTLAKIRQRVESRMTSENSGAKISALDLLETYMKGIKLKKKFSGYGERMWHGVVLYRVKKSQAKMNPKYVSRRFLIFLSRISL